MENLMIFVIGGFSTGKTEFVRTLCGNHETYESYKEPCAYDHGQIAIKDNTKLHFFGNPGALRPPTAWERLDFDATMLGFIIMAESVDHYSDVSLPEARAIIDFVRLLEKYPFLIAANKQDKPGAIASRKLRSELYLEDDEVILPCVATNRRSTQQVALSFLRSIPQTETVDAAISVIEAL